MGNPCRVTVVVRSVGPQNVADSVLEAMKKAADRRVLKERIAFDAAKNDFTVALVVRVLGGATAGEKVLAAIKAAVKDKTKTPDPFVAIIETAIEEMSR